MEQTKASRIKTAIRENFDASAEGYGEFERRHGFFKSLSARLIDFLEPPAGGRILDIGCGTGASCIQILDAVPGSAVWGLDNSLGMLEAARSICGNRDRVTFVHGDAAKLKEIFTEPFHAAMYSASIFLIPDFLESLRQARDLLLPKGRVGLTFMDGLYDGDGNNLFQLADREAHEGVSLKKPVQIEELRLGFSSLFARSREKNEAIELPQEVLRQFFSLPAMSAGLFPGFAYEERVRKVGRIFDHMPKSPMVFRWILMVGGNGS